MDVLRTPDDCFAGLPDFDYRPNYVQLGPVRVHYLDEGTGPVILCLHGEPTWSFLYRKMIAQLKPAHRVVAPDFVGFGRSDKYAKRDQYTWQMHQQVLRDFLTSVDLRGITLVCQDWGGLIGLSIAAEMPERFDRLVIMNTGLPTGDEPPTEGFLRRRAFATQSDDLPIGLVMQRTIVGGDDVDPRVIAAYEAPFPDKSFKAGTLEFPCLVPIKPDDSGSEIMRRTRKALENWTKPALVMFSDGDPVTKGGDRFFRRLIPSAKNEPEIVVQGGGHFLQEDSPDQLSKEIAAFIARRPVGAA